jgi:hypothetical protein
MDHSRFDDITKILAAPSRRSLLGIAGAAALAAVLGWDDADARRKKKKKKKPKPCTENCVGKVCGESNGCGGACTACPTGKTCINGVCVTTSCSPACTSGQHCCDALGFGTFGCWNCCDDQDCIDNAVFNAQGRVVCRSGGCNCPDELPALCPAGFGTAAQQCTDPRSDKRNCHPDRFTCGPGCPNDPDWECCDGACAFLPGCVAGGSSGDCQRQHCGTCGTPCLGEGIGCCNGACVDMTQDPNCGACGADCSAVGKICDGGTCHECECEEEQGD